MNLNSTRLSNGALTRFIFELFIGVDCKDKVQLHCDPEFNSAVPAEKVNFKILNLKRSFIMIDPYPLFHLDIPPSPCMRKEKALIHFKQESSNYAKAKVAH